MHLYFHAMFQGWLRTCLLTRGRKNKIYKNQIGSTLTDTNQEKVFRVAQNYSMLCNKIRVLPSNPCIQASLCSAQLSYLSMNSNAESRKTSYRLWPAWFRIYYIYAVFQCIFVGQKVTGTSETKKVLEIRINSISYIFDIDKYTKKLKT